MKLRKNVVLNAPNRYGFVAALILALVTLLGVAELRALGAVAVVNSRAQPSSDTAGASAGINNTPVALQGRKAHARIDFDLQSGLYSFHTSPSGTPAILNAYMAVEGWATSDVGYHRRIVKQTENRLSIECARAGAPTLLLEFTLQSGFVELRAGLKNTTEHPLRIKKIWPLAKGAIFPGAAWTEARTLDAPSGVNQPRVTADIVRSSANNLLLTFKQDGVRRSLVFGALQTADFTKWAHTFRGDRVGSQALLGPALREGAGHVEASVNTEDDPVLAGLEAYDPVGRLVEPGESYLPADSFYLDVGTANPFTALERYGLALRQAADAPPNPYDFPTVCAWYAGVFEHGDAQTNPAHSKYQLNTSSGLVGEAAAIEQCGFLNYSRAAVRLVPDTYTEYNPQGWWDDAHWQKHGYYTAPYETSALLGRGMHDQGCLAFIYIQPMIQPPSYKHLLSRDFRDGHTDWLLNKTTNSFYNLDYSHPAVQQYMRSKFSALRGHLDGLMVDYADQLWLSTLYGRSPEARLATSTYENVPPGDQPSPALFTDSKATATSFYRTFFSLLRQSLGPKAWIHERNLEQPNNDLALGLVDSQRTALDTKLIDPALVARSGLRWYKNRVVLAYDMDSKDLNTAWKAPGWSGSAQDGLRMTLTAAYVAASRLLLANSFRDLQPEVLRDLGRTFPYHTEARSARPIDMLVCENWPSVYDFAVNPNWHQVTIFNNSLPTREKSFAVPLSGDNAEGALGLDPGHSYFAYDFWNDTFIGKLKGTEVLRQTLRPGEARMISVRRAEDHPQVLSSSQHLMQGYLDIDETNWREPTLSGKAAAVAGQPHKIVIALNGRRPADEHENVKISGDGQVAVITIESGRQGGVAWSLRFK